MESEVFLSHVMRLSILDYITSYLKQANSLSPTQRKTDVKFRKLSAVRAKPRARYLAAKLFVNLVLALTVFQNGDKNVQCGGVQMMLLIDLKARIWNFHQASF